MSALRLVTDNDDTRTEAERMFAGGCLRDAVRYLRDERGFDPDHVRVVLEVQWHGLSPLQLAYVDMLLRDRPVKLGALA